MSKRKKGFQNRLEKKPRRQRQTGIMQFFFCKKIMNKIAFGRIIDKCLITTGFNYLTNLDLKVFFRQVPKLHHYIGPKNWCNFGTWCNLGWCNLGVTTVLKLNSRFQKRSYRRTPMLSDLPKN